MSKIKKFVLAYEPKGYGIKHHYIIDFKDNNIKLVKVEKYKGIISSKCSKHTLSEIDSFTLKYPDQQTFLHDITGIADVYELFAGYESKGFINKIRPVFDNPNLMKKLELCKGNNIYDKIEISRMVDLLTNIDNGFSNRFLNNSKYYKPKGFESLVSNVKKLKKLEEYEPCFETAQCIYDNTESMRSELTKYYIYREVFRAKQDYLNELNQNNLICNDTEEREDNKFLQLSMLDYINRKK